MTKADGKGNNGQKTLPNDREPSLAISVGSVTGVERDEIRRLFERKNGLSELFRSLAGLSKAELESSPLYERLVGDMGENATLFQGWWDRMSNKYSWESLPGYKWEIDFESCEVSRRKQ